LEKEREKNRKEFDLKESKRKQDYQLRKQKFEDSFKIFQKLKDDIFRLRSFTGHSSHQTEIGESITNFKWIAIFVLLKNF